MTFSFIKSEIREEIIGFMIAGEVGIFPKKCFTISCSWLPASYDFNVNNTEIIQKDEGEKCEEQGRHYLDWILSVNHDMQMQMFCLAKHGFNIRENLFETGEQNES